MIDTVLSLPTSVAAPIVIFLTTTIGVSIYLASYRLFAKHQTAETAEATNSLFRVVGILLSLFLSLTFADVILEMNAIETAIEKEAVSLLDIHNDLRRFGDEETRDIQRVLVAYTRAILEDDWPALANDSLGERAGALLLQIEDAVIEIESTNFKQETLRDRIIADVDTVPDYRLSRLENALAKPPAFLIVVLFAFLVTMVCFSTHPPALVNVTLISLYATLVGMVIFLILAFSDPFQGSTSADPAPFEYVLERMEKPVPVREVPDRS
jgi:hypothetical protein